MIGPYGEVDATDDFNAQNDGAPLLFSKIKFGVMYIYEMSFTFYGKTYFFSFSFLIKICIFNLGFAHVHQP